MRKITNIAITSMLLITALFVIVLYLMSDTNLPNNDDEELIDFNYGWEYSINNGGFVSCQSPLDLIGKNAEVLVLKNVIPQVDNNENYLQFNVSRTMVKIYLENELVFNIDEEDLSPVGKSPGNMPLFVELPDMNVGDEIKLELIPVYGEVEMTSFYLGHESAGIYNMIRNELFNFVISAIMVVFGLVEIAFYIFVGRRNKALHMLQLGFLTLLAGLYTFTVLPMLSLILSEPYIISVASYLLLSLLPIPVLFFLCTAYELKYKKPIYVMIIVHTVYWFMIIVLQANNLLDVRQTIKICHLILTISISMIIVTAIYEMAIRKNKKVRTFIIGVVTLCLFTVIDLITYYFSYETYMSTFFKMGVIGFSAVLFLGYTRDLAEMIKQNARTKIYEKLAYQDVLTSSKNRTCFEKDLDAFRSKSQNIENLILGIFDVNNLKVINDTQGHKQGDRLLISAHDAILRTFENTAVIYRIGGDEFAIISTDIIIEQAPMLLKKLETNAKKISNISGLNLSIAGSLGQYDKKQDTNIEDLMRRVDKAMYARKQEMKNAE